MLIPGWLISILTFPGIIIHELAHKKFCDWTGVPVHKIVYFRLGNPAGYVAHEEPKKYSQTFWISIGPLVINSILAVAFSFIASQYSFGSSMYYLFLWISFSVGMHSFPSDDDMRHVAEASKVSVKNGGSILYYLAFPLVWLIWIANKLRFFWFDGVYAILLVYVGGGLM